MKTGILCDLDGTVVDSRPEQQQLMCGTLTPAGLRARTADHLPRLAVDRWSPGSSRVVIDPAVLDLTDAEPVVTGEAVDRRAPLLPRPRHVVER